MLRAVAPDLWVADGSAPFVDANGRARFGWFPVSRRAPLLLKKVRLANKRNLPSLRLYFTEVLAERFAALRSLPTGEISR